MTQCSIVARRGRRKSPYRVLPCGVRRPARIRQGFGGLNSADCPVFGRHRRSDGSWCEDVLPRGSVWRRPRDGQGPDRHHGPGREPEIAKRPSGWGLRPAVDMPQACSRARGEGDLHLFGREGEALSGRLEISLPACPFHPGDGGLQFGRIAETACCLRQKVDAPPAQNAASSRRGAETVLLRALFSSLPALVALRRRWAQGRLTTALETPQTRRLLCRSRVQPEHGAGPGQCGARGHRIAVSALQKIGS